MALRLRLLMMTALAVLVATSGVHAATLIERFSSDNQFSDGTIVSNTNENPSTVEPTTINTVNQAVGVVQAKEKSLFQVSGDGNNLNIAKTGIATILVSDENGPIVEGDLLSVASVAGVAVRESGQTIIVGTALEDFNEDSEPITTTVIPDVSQEVNVGRIQARIDVKLNPNSDSFQADAPSFLETLAERITGKRVSSVRVLAAFISLIITIIASIALFSALVTGTQDSEQRNPNSHSSLHKSEHQLLLMIFAVFVVGIAMSFAIILV